jgi:Malectin-like domain
MKEYSLLHLFQSTMKNSYPDDQFDRWWWSFTNRGWENISFNNANIALDNDFQTPPAVLRTAVTSASTKEPLTLLWSSDNSSTRCYFILHFYDQKPATGQREFNILFNGLNELDEPMNLDGWGWTTHWTSGFTDYNLSLVATSNSTLPPLLNALELYVEAPVGHPTYAEDGNFSSILN